PRAARPAAILPSLSHGQAQGRWQPTNKNRKKQVAVNNQNKNRNICPLSRNSGLFTIIQENSPEVRGFMRNTSCCKLHTLSRAVTRAIQSTNSITLARNAAVTALTLAMSGTLYAQDVEEVTITGSRIQRPGLTAPTPVTSVSQADADLLSTFTLAEGLDALPQFLNTSMLAETQ